MAFADSLEKTEAVRLPHPHESSSNAKCTGRKPYFYIRFKENRRRERGGKRNKALKAEKEKIKHRGRFTLGMEGTSQTLADRSGVKQMPIGSEHSRHVKHNDTWIFFKMARYNEMLIARLVDYVMTACYELLSYHGMTFINIYYKNLRSYAPRSTDLSFSCSSAKLTLRVLLLYCYCILSPLILFS